jgi:hypothetical protein
MSYEGKMARNSLRKAIAYSTELLSMISATDELEPWIQAKINDMDHYIETVYGYYKFGEDMDEPVESIKEYENQTYVDSDGQITVGDYKTKHFDICPSAQKLYSSIKDKTVMIHLIVETMMLQDLLFRLEKQAIAQGSIDEDDLEKAEEFAELIMDNAEQMNLLEEHSYIEDVHLAKFKQLAGVSISEEEMEEDGMSENYMEMAQNSLFVTIKHEVN